MATNNQLKTTSISTKVGFFALFAYTIFFLGLLQTGKLNAQSLDYHVIVPPGLDMSGIKKVALAPFTILIRRL